MPQGPFWLHGFFASTDHRSDRRSVVVPLAIASALGATRLLGHDDLVHLAMAAAIAEEKSMPKMLFRFFKLEHTIKIYI